MSDSINQPIILIEPNQYESFYWRELWRYRELFMVLAWRDVAVRYKQTVIGLAWALIRPFLTVVVFTFIFGHIATLPSDGNVPYSLLVFVGMLPWFLFSSILNDASNSLVGNSNLISKVYFPRLIIPTAVAVVALIDFSVNCFILVLLMLWFGIAPGWQIAFLPVLVALTVIAGLGPAMWVSAVSIKYRDIKFVVPFIIQFGLYLSPVGFSSAVVPSEWRLIYSLNPMVGIIEAFRWCIFGGQSNVYWVGFFLGLLVIIFSLWYGYRYFRMTEKKIADLV